MLKIIHDKYRTFNASSALKKKPPESKVAFVLSFTEAKKANSELEKHVKKALDDLNPLKVLNLFRQITATDCELLGIDPAQGRPEMFIWQYVPAPPVCIRPSVNQDSASTEDDITAKLADIVHISSLIRGGLQKGQPIQTIMEQWEFLQIQIAMYINSDAPGLQQAGFGKVIRGFCQRLKGKQGRFRGNLSGKRVDFSGRTVISPDPNLGIDEVAVPVLVAKNLTYPERVSRYNLAKLQQRVRNGARRWPGANYLAKRDNDFKIFLKYGRTDVMADQLQVGDVVERHLEDGDVVLFNRQPSLHKLSILSHYVRVRPWKTFRLNECVCNPYNADFDGDEMNLHVPQTEEARTEAIQLMGVKDNLVTPKNGEPIISAIQDFITAAYLLSSKDTFYDRKTFANVCMYMVDGDMQIDLPPPAILKPEALWTGKQVFNVLMRPNRASPVLVNLDAACREYKVVKDRPRDLDENDGWLVIRNSEVMCGVMDKSTIGSGKKDSVFYVILRDFGPDEAVRAMNRLAKLAARWLTNQGFSIGIDDVFPGRKLVELKQTLVETAYEACDEVIASFRAGQLEKSPGCNEEQTMENTISGILSRVRQQAGEYCIRELSRWNAPLIMATCGSKGSNINVSQMVAVVGQQIIGGSRVPDGFQDRSLPHFPKNARHPPSKGFVRNSFFSGLTPTEFLFHAISGREGLVDTAVKTAETGYMSRRLMKSLEDLSSQYDDTVRNSSSGVVQFQYGDDKLDPVDMEGRAKPVHFDRTFNHAEVGGGAVSRGVAADAPGNHVVRVGRGPVASRHLAAVRRATGARGGQAGAERPRRDAARLPGRLDCGRRPARERQGLSRLDPALRAPPARAAGGTARGAWAAAAARGARTACVAAPEAVRGRGEGGAAVRGTRGPRGQAVGPHADGFCAIMPEQVQAGAGRAGSRRGCRRGAVDWRTGHADDAQNVPLCRRGGHEHHAGRATHQGDN